MEKHFIVVNDASVSNHLCRQEGDDERAKTEAPLPITGSMFFEGMVADSKHLFVNGQSRHEYVEETPTHVLVRMHGDIKLVEPIDGASCHALASPDTLFSRRTGIAYICFPLLSSKSSGSLRIISSGMHCSRQPSIAQRSKRIVSGVSSAVHGWN